MCPVDFLDPCFCCCKNQECPRVRPRENHLFVTGQIPWRRHIIRGGSWEKTLQHEGLPCNDFWAMPGAAEAVCLSGRGDDGMWDVAIANCPNLRPRVLEGAVLYVQALCEYCREHCEQRQAFVTPKASELNPPNMQGPEAKDLESKTPKAGAAGKK